MREAHSINVFYDSQTREKDALLGSPNRFTASLKRLIPYSCGFAFYWAWLMLSFYVTSPFPDNVVNAPTLTNLSWFLSAAGNAIALAYFIVRSKRVSSLANPHPRSIAFGLLVALGSLFGAIGFLMSDESLIWLAASVIGFFIAGGSSAFLAIAWGIKVIQLSRSEICVVNSCTLILAGCIHLLLSSINSITMLIVVLVLPILSGIILAKYSHVDKSKQDAFPEKNPSFSTKRSFGIAIPLGTCALYAFCGELLRNASASSIGVTEMGLYYDMGLIIGSLSILANERYSGFRQMAHNDESEGFKALRPMFTAMALAFMITVIFSMPYYFAYLCFAVGFAGLRIYAWTYCSFIVKKFDFNPIRTLSVMVAAFSMGPLVASPLIQLIALDGDLWNKITLSMICIMFFVVMHIMDGTQYETVWGLIETGTDEQSSSMENFSLISEVFGLTARETEVARLLAQGRSLPYIESCLHISSSTAQTHQRHIYSKMNVHNRQDFLDVVHKTISIESSDLS